jgi:hypothetical protein
VGVGIQEQIAGGRECQICFDIKIDFFEGLSCGHNEFCMECTRNMLAVSIKDSKVMRINCIQHKCTEAFKDEQIKKVLSTSSETEGLYKKYLRFK